MCSDYASIRLDKKKITKILLPVWYQRLGTNHFKEVFWDITPASWDEAPRLKQENSCLMTNRSTS